MAEIKKDLNVNKKPNTPATEKEDVFEQEFLSTGQLAWRILKKHKLGLISMWLLIILYFFAIFADFFSPMEPNNNHEPFRFSPPQAVRFNDPVTDRNVGMHVNLFDKAKDKFTFKQWFVEATHLDKIKGVTEDGKEVVLALGESNKDASLGIIGDISYTFETTYKVKLKDGSMLSGIPSEDVEKRLLPIEMFTKNKNGTAKDLGNGFVDPSFTKVLKGEEFIYEAPETRKDAIMDIVNATPDLAGKEVVEIYNVYKLKTIVVSDADYNSVELTPDKIKAVAFKNYNIKFFIQSWDWKLMGLIPTNLHFFGTEKPKLTAYNEYLSNDGMLLLWGADKYGRDMLSRIMFGSRVSLSVGLVGIFITFTIGLFLGGAAGFFGGWLDEVIMRFTEILMSIPGFYLLVSLSAIIPQNIDPGIKYIFVTMILSFIGWPGMARVIRGMTLGLKQTEYIEAAIALGYPPRRVIWRHLIPNTTTYIIISATLAIPSYILGEAGLGFLGLGITEPSASWGLMLNQAQSIEALTNAPWLLISGLFIFITALAFNLFGDALRDALDPRALGH